MTRDEAIERLRLRAKQAFEAYVSVNNKHRDEARLDANAFDFGVYALNKLPKDATMFDGAEALLPWVRTADRKPVAKEVGSHVFGLHRDGFVYPMNTTSISQRHFPYWMPIPPLPEADHE